MASTPISPENPNARFGVIPPKPGTMTTTMVRNTSCGKAIASTWYGCGLLVVRTYLKLSPFSCHNHAIVVARSLWRALLQQPMTKTALVDTKNQKQNQLWNPPLWFGMETMCKTTASSVPVQRSNDTPQRLSTAKQRVKISMNLPFGLLNNEESWQCMRRSYSTTSTTVKDDDDDDHMDSSSKEDKNNSEYYKDNYNDSQWLEYYNTLEEYIQETGGVEKITDIKKPVLMHWVFLQREEFQLWKEGQPTSMTLERQEKLDQQGIFWRYTDEWFRFYLKLEKYHTKHGNCLVPQRCKKRPKLGKWVRDQRKQFKRYKKGKKPYYNLDARRVAQLDRLDFEEDANDAVWRNRYEELEDYTKLHGDCMVPRNYSEKPELGTWVIMQRRAYKRRKEGKLNRYFTEERIRLLEKIGFNWVPLDRAWMERYNELVEYAKLHGDCMVPQNYSEKPELGMWVNMQRKEYKRWKEGKLNRCFTEERIRLLEKIGFDWDPFESAWMERYNELVEYAKLHGDCMVPHNYAEKPELGIWVNNQRQNYKRWKEGKLNRYFTEERIRLLEKIGFDWDPLENAWMERYHELVEYAKLNGDCMVPQKYPEKPELGMWVCKQRCLYKQFQEGRSCGMTEERIAMLEHVGFVWNARAVRGKGSGH